MLKVINGGKMGTRASKYSAFVDLYANEDCVIGAGETVKVGLGVCVDEDIDDFKREHYLQLEPRSSLRAKGLISGTGIIDLDYTEEIKIILHNPITIDIDSDYSYKNYKITKGDRIAQITLMEHKSYLLNISSEDERSGGFGSSGDR